MLGESDISALFKALQFSAEKHRHQRRKDKEASPYINHPIDVAATLWKVGKIRDSNVLTAAVLHDTIEDTNTTPEDIEGLFGDKVRSLVVEVTDDKTLPKEVRKRLQVETASHKSAGAKLIKLADKICNVQDISHAPPANWSLERRREYLDWAEKVVHGLRGTNSFLEKRFDEVLLEGRKNLGVS
jgi:GTP diphosphokinase / guanosine-3',5'-bis(diphosphate) 3'-diphosphatase